MAKTRSLVFILFCGFLPMLYDRVVDGQWPDWSLAKWTVFLGGLVVIAIAFIVGESWYAKRHAADPQCTVGVPDLRSTDPS